MLSCTYLLFIYFYRYMYHVLGFRVSIHTNDVCMFFTTLKIIYCTCIQLPVKDDGE